MVSKSRKKRSTGKANKHTLCGRRCSKNKGRAWPLMPDRLTPDQAWSWFTLRYP